MKFHSQTAWARSRAAGLLAAVMALFSACGGGSEDPLASQAQASANGGATMTTAAPPSSRTGRLPDWCGQTLTFDNNSLPTNWSVRSVVRGGPGIVDNRLLASPVDSGIAIASQTAALPPAVERLDISYDSQADYSYWGAFRVLELAMADGSVWLFGEYSASYRIPEGSREFSVQHNTAPWPLSGQNLYLDPFQATGFAYGLQANRVSIANGQATWTLTAADGTTQTVQRTLPADFSVSNVVGVNLFVYTTTDSSTWMDNVNIQCLRGRAPAL